MENDDASTPETEVVDFDGHPGVPMSEIFTVIKGYLAGAPPTERIIVVLRNGTVLHLEATENNRTAVARWRASSRRHRHSG
jgi:hypothetical protein